MLVAEQAVPASVPTTTPSETQQSFDEFLAEFPDLIEEFYLKGDQTGVDQAVARLESHGVDLPWGVEGEAGSRWVMFHDPAGNLIELT